MNTHYLNGLPQEWTAIAEVFSALGDARFLKYFLIAFQIFYTVCRRFCR